VRDEQGGQHSLDDTEAAAEAECRRGTGSLDALDVLKDGHLDDVAFVTDRLQGSREPDRAHPTLAVDLDVGHIPAGNPAVADDGDRAGQSWVNADE
jgi:hypothetical protein